MGITGLVARAEALRNVLHALDVFDPEDAVQILAEASRQIAALAGPKAASPLRMPEPEPEPEPRPAPVPEAAPPPPAPAVATPAGKAAPAVPPPPVSEVRHARPRVPRPGPTGRREWTKETLAALARKGPMRPMDVANAMGVSDENERQTVRATLANLFKRGALRRDAAGNYLLTG